MKVSIRIFDKDEQTFLSMVISQAAKRLDIALTFSDASSADVVFVKEDEPGAGLFADACAMRPGPLAVVYGGTTYKWCLERPATTKSLIALLPMLCAKLPASQPAAPANQPLQTGTPPTQPALLLIKNGALLLDEIRQLSLNAPAWAITIPGNLRILADIREGLVYFPEGYSWRIRDLFKLAFTTNNVLLQAIDSADIASLTTQMHSMPLEGFLWLSAQEAEPESVHSLGNDLLERKFKLTRWPSFSRFEHTSQQIALSGRLMKQATTLGELIGLNSTTSSEVLRFYNSACMCGLIQLEKTATTSNSDRIINMPPPPVREEKAGVFSRILKHFAG